MTAPAPPAPRKKDWRRITELAAAAAVAAAAATIGIKALTHHDIPGPMDVKSPPAITATAPAPTTGPAITLKPTTRPTAATRPTATRPVEVPAPIGRKLGLPEEIRRAESADGPRLAYEGVKDIPAGIRDLSNSNGGTGKVYSMPLRETPTSAIEQEVKREWDAVRYMLRNQGRADPQNPPVWYTPQEWKKIMDEGSREELSFRMALCVKERAVLNDYNNQRMSGFPGGAYTIPDETNALEILINLHRIPIPPGTRVKTSHEAAMTPAQYAEHEKRFAATHGPKQRFRYRTKDIETEVEGWRLTGEGRIYLSPEASITDMQVQRMVEQYGEPGEVNVLGKNYIGWTDRESNTIIYVREDGSITRMTGARLPTATRPTTGPTSGPTTRTRPTTGPTTKPTEKPATAPEAKPKAPKGVIESLKEETERLKVQTERERAQAELERAKRDVQKAKTGK